MTSSRRIGLVHLLLALFVIALLAKSARVQLWQGRRWAATALRQQSTERSIPAPRGPILDARGEMLAQSRETVKLEIAPTEVRNLRRLRQALQRGGIPAEWVARATDPRRRWVMIPGRYLAIDVAAATAMRGVYTTPVVERSYAISAGTRHVVGRVDADGRAVDGLELALDSLLRGKAGSATVMRDARGRRFESPSSPGAPPVQGNTVVLTINQELQEIAERALADAVASMEAEGGDVLVLDPSNGEVLAMASQRGDPRATASTALTEPYEPGSTVKPLIASALLQQNRARETEIVNTFGGQLTINGRTITDDHPAAQYSLADVIRFSSNIGIVQFASRLQPREEFEALRDFGFGMPTGIAYPVEAAGTLRDPTRWSRQSANSMAMGYEIAVTPMQLASAYVAIANGGELLEPTLVREVRDPQGAVRYRHTRRVVRRVMSADVARRVRRMLLGVVEEGGTAKRADLGNFSLAGKTGTTRRIVNGQYRLSEHIPTFVGLFPGDNPQFVILVKLDNPKGAYSGGLTAAPVTKAVIEAALASRNASLDRGHLAASRVERPATPDRVAAVAALETGDSADARRRLLAQRAALADSAEVPTASVVALLPLPPDTAHARPLADRMIPDVAGLSVRSAVHALHAAGFRVRLVNGPAAVTSPGAGSIARAGSLVHLGTSP